MPNAPLWPCPVTAKALEAYRAELGGKPAPVCCPSCGGTGYVKDADTGKVEHCAICNTAARARWLSDNCGLTPAEMEAATLIRYRQGKWTGHDEETIKLYRAQRLAVYHALKEIDEHRAGLYTFFGDYGSGKSLALQIAVNDARAASVESFYAPFSLILTHLRQLVATHSDTSHFLSRLMDIPVLAMDEVTRFNETPWAREQLFILIDTRYRRRNSHLTLLATNDDPRVFLDTGDDVGYLFSRCRQGKLFELRGDMRQENS